MEDSNGRYASGAQFERVAGAGSSGIRRQPIGKIQVVVQSAGSGHSPQTPRTGIGSTWMFDDNERPDNASRILAIAHFDADIRSIVIIGASDPAYDGSDLTECMTTCSFLVGKYASFVVFGLFPVLVRVKIKASHPSRFPQEMDCLSRVPSSVLVIASHKFGISGQSDDPVSGTADRSKEGQLCGASRI